MYDKPIAMIENVSVDIIARLCAQTCTRNCYALTPLKMQKLHVNCDKMHLPQKYIFNSNNAEILV